MSTPGQRKAGIASNTGGDLYETPPEAIKALLDREKFLGPIWEPAAGRGAIAQAFRNAGWLTVETDIVSHPLREHPLIWERDFLFSGEAPRHPSGYECRSLVTNPPFSLLTKFMHHAAMPTLYLDKWALLIPLNALSGRARRAKIYDIHPPTRVLVFSERIKFRRDGYEGKVSPLGVHAWAIWHRDIPKTTTMEWI
tara:strand:+ start:44 stop:631 length:588 start_codon:yes stop_codon:yes gene_type:complete